MTAVNINSGTIKNMVPTISEERVFKNLSGKLNCRRRNEKGILRSGFRDNKLTHLEMLFFPNLINMKSPAKRGSNIYINSRWNGQFSKLKANHATRGRRMITMAIFLFTEILS